jgi:hypothetical protein
MAKEVRIKMLATHADPSMVLHEGKVYVVPVALAAALMLKGAGKEDNSPAAELAKAGKKAVRPTKPDPGEEEDTVVDDEDEDDNTPDTL